MNNNKKLIEEHTLLTAELAKETQRLNEIMPPVQDISAWEKPKVWDMTKESLAEFDLQLKKVEGISKRLREILGE